MIVYLDSSIILRKVLNQKNSLKELQVVEAAYSSDLLKIECNRVIDRLRLQRILTDTQVAKAREEIHEYFGIISFVSISKTIVDKASEIFPVIVSSLDSIHLASVYILKQEFKIKMATHDDQLGNASRALGIEVIGC